MGQFQKNIHPFLGWILIPAFLLEVFDRFADWGVAQVDPRDDDAIKFGNNLVRSPDVLLSSD